MALMGNKHKLILLVLVLSGYLGALNAQSRKNQKANILLIVADDLGYTDLGCYGGDISTPSIDQLARTGIQFVNFHASPLCAPTRSMLLTGNDNHVAGMGSMFSVKGTSREGKPGYEHHLTDRIVTVARLLKEGGYQTFMAGKWHLGSEDPYIPAAKGFDRSFSLMNGAANHFNNEQVLNDQLPQYRLDQHRVPFPDGKFSTDVYTEKMTEFIVNRQQDKPFFAYLAYTAPHWPLQVPADYLDIYKGRYDIGYDSLRVVRFNAQKARGILQPQAVLPPRNPMIKPWHELSADEKKIEARKMELYAAMVHNLDEHIGQLIKFLKDSNQYDNTFIVFMSDNGAAAEDFYNDAGGYGPFLREHFDNRYENMGKPSSFVSYGPQWAQTGAAPFRLHKGFSTEGGIVAPLIISGKGVERKPGIQNTFINVMDFAPTFLEVAGLSYPNRYGNKEMKPMLGESILSFIRNKSNFIHNSNYTYGLEHDGQCLLIKGNWKITNTSKPFDEMAFGLYDLLNDPGETDDLSKSSPEKYAEMMKEWELFKKRAGVIVKDKEK